MIRAGVIAANFSWNAKYRSSGIVEEYPRFGAVPTLFSPKSAYNAFVTRRRVGLAAAARSLLRTFLPFARRLKLRDRQRLRLRVGHLLVALRPFAATRESREPDDGEEDAGESDDVRDELRGIGEATMDADDLPADVEDPEVRALVAGVRRRQVELRVFGRAQDHVAVDLVLCDERSPDVPPQRVHLPPFRDERRDEDR